MKQQRHPGIGGAEKNGCELSGNATESYRASQPTRNQPTPIYVARLRRSPLTGDDLQREYAIADAWYCCVTAYQEGDHDLARQHAAVMTDLINQRTPSAVWSVRCAGRFEGVRGAGAM